MYANKRLRPAFPFSQFVLAADGLLDHLEGVATVGNAELGIAVFQIVELVGRHVGHCDAKQALGVVELEFFATVNNASIFLVESSWIVLNGLNHVLERLLTFRRGTDVRVALVEFRRFRKWQPGFEVKAAR
jgi:hypothetical protein